MFKQIDTSGDGTIQNKEMADGFTNLSTKVKLALGDPQVLIESMDLDKNGVIDYTEFITAAVDKIFLVTNDNL